MQKQFNSRLAIADDGAIPRNAETVRRESTPYSHFREPLVPMGQQAVHLRRELLLTSLDSARGGDAFAA